MITYTELLQITLLAVCVINLSHLPADALKKLARISITVISLSIALFYALPNVLLQTAEIPITPNPQLANELLVPLIGACAGIVFLFWFLHISTPKLTEISTPVRTETFDDELDS